MKKIKLSLTFLFVFFLMLNNANAAELKIGTQIGVQERLVSTGLTINGNPYTQSGFTVDFDGQKHVGYCMDPNAVPTVNPVVRDILGGESRTVSAKVYDAGLLTILKEGYNPTKSSLTVTNANGTFSVSGEAFYVATSIAVRAYTIGFWDYGKDNKNNPTTASAHANLAVLWNEWIPAGDKEILKNYNNLESLSKKSWYRSNYIFDYPSDVSKNTIYVAQSLFYKGLESAAAYARGDVKEAKISINANDTDVSINGNLRTMTRTIVIKTSNFGTNGVLRSADITFSPNAHVSVTGISYYYNGIKTNNLNDISLKDNPELEIVFNIQTTNSDCDPLTYTLKYAYQDDSIKVTGAILDSEKAIIDSSGSTSQRYVFMVPRNNDENIENEIKGSVQLCSNNCETEITVPKKCTDLKSGANAEWVESSIQGPTNITKCVIGEKVNGEWSNKYDDASNTYKANTCNNTQDEDNGISRVASNSYCAVYCKEDYASIKFSGIKTINSGRYFKIGAKIEGTKTCYTSRIDTEQYLDDIIKIQQDMIIAYDLWLNYKAALQDFEDYSLGCGCCGGTRTGYRTSGQYMGVTANTPNYTTGSVTYKNQSKNHYSRNESGTSCYLGSCEGEDCDPPCLGSCQDGYNFEPQLNTLLLGTANKLATLKRSYEKIVASYQSCSSLESDGWENVFDFNQIINYDYDEDYINMKTLSAKDKRLEVVNQKDKDVDNWICNGDLASNDAGKYNSCSTSLGYKTASRSYMVCTVSEGCKAETKAISTARYVKKTSEKSATYDTPRVFYTAFPSGNIVTKKDANNSKLQTEVVDGLPVSLKTEVGAHKFKYEIKNLGEFYDNCKTGRLVGAKNSVVNQKTTSNKYKFTGEYICYYKVNCPECTFICESDDGGECSWDIPNKCKDGGCCVNCIFTIDRLQLYFRSISTNVFNPSKRSLGYNWNYNFSVSDINYGFIAGKAKETVNGTEGIVTKGENVYKNTPILTVNLTPDLAKEIRAYNKSAENSGGYANDSITCYDYVEKGVTYKNLFCYSDFLDQFNNDGGTKDKFSFINSRLALPDARKNSADQNGYWDIYTTNMQIVTESTIGGPSWK